MILGTAQLGQEYGIHNTTGKPEEEQVYQILDYALRHGVGLLDTAEAYGDAEALIGKYQEAAGNPFRICTKLLFDETIVRQTSGIVEIMEDKLKESLYKLKCHQIWLYYLHQFSFAQDDSVIQKMREWKQKGKVQKIGISIYEPKELRYILEYLHSIVDVVQIPFHLLNNNEWMEDGLLQRAKERKIKIFARSVFLQGLFFQDPDSDIVKQLSMREVLLKLRQIAEEASMSIGQMAVFYVAQHPYIDDFMLGCETVTQLKQDIALENESRGHKLPKDVLKGISGVSEIVKGVILDPREWKVG